MRVLVLAAVGAAAVATSAQSANLIANGTFEAGNTGFGSDYTYTATDTTPPAVYTVDDDPSDLHPLFSSFGDHTSGSGLMMIVNGSEVAGQRVWYEDNIAVLANTTYFFSTWIASAHPASPAQLAFSINGSQIGLTFVASSSTGLWQQFYATWNSGSDTSADVALVNQNLTFHGNDFALDDIQLDTVLKDTEVPEPSTWALLIVGFGAAGGMLRRRRTASA